MSEKTKIVAALGEGALSLPGMVNAALAANDRVKYRFALLQAARSRAEHPDAPQPDLARERLASGVADAELDQVVEAATREARGYRIPHAERIFVDIQTDIREMLSPLATVSEQEDYAEARPMAARLDRLLAGLEAPADDLVTGGALTLATSGDREAGDSLHLLVMDAHKLLNRLQAGIASETLDGAAVYGLEGKDRQLVLAFMRGVHRTAPLKFDHPGLGTTATRSGETLLIQNDIGTTDAHVLVVHVNRLTVSITYTDVHLQRLLYFQSLFERYDVLWEDARSRKAGDMEGGIFHLCLGNFTALSQSQLEEFMAFLGSRLVYLIDWNRARKRLRQFLRKDDAIGLLKWAADQDYGHMAFLRCGGEQMLFDAMEFVVRGNYKYGEQLHDMLGENRAMEYMKFVLKTCTESLLANRPFELVHDEVRAELFNYFRSAEQGLLDIVTEHAAFVVEIANGLRDAWLAAHLPDAPDLFARKSQDARLWEHKADELVNRARIAVKRSNTGQFYQQVVEMADDIADDLEEAAFHLTLLPRNPTGDEYYAPLMNLIELALSGAQEYLKALESSRYVRRSGAREDMQDFLEAVHRIVVVEQDSDEAQRRVEQVLVSSCQDCKEMYVLSETARDLEQATDSLLHTALSLRDQILARIMA